jgi:DNA-binding MarR family transcriptional regulator
MTKTNDVAVKLIAQLLPHIQQYSNTPKATATLDGFNEWMMEQTITTNNNTGIKNKVHTQPQIPAVEIKINSRIASGIGVLYRYSKSYCKNIFKNSIVQSVDEFTYLVGISNIPNISKTALIETMVQEKTTGTEIIKRLITKKLIVEVINKHDKRSKLISISAKGHQELAKLYPSMEKISNTIVGDLSTPEKKALDMMIAKLEKHHRRK